ncbi:hypothetical protein [Sinosporangium siamense]|uniref:Uncharacterized protein n=1 Tax=Sinosporangium siamense TaxID=1367973 RepID=A0A919V6A7_9ACTN|nr:hypothetical protein [Sinosporangium siamense]GII92298.1 hypothetical protein Ssi02_25290 [Sinosporangium siamense]
MAGLHRGNLHVTRPADQCEELSWHIPTRAGERVRVREWTCECRAIVYELCFSGGVGFVRRTKRRGRQVAVAETDRWGSRRVREVWSALLAGRMR